MFNLLDFDKEYSRANGKEQVNFQKVENIVSVIIQPPSPTKPLLPRHSRIYCSIDKRDATVDNCGNYRNDTTKWLRQRLIY